MDARTQRRLRREAYKDSAEWKAKEEEEEVKREKARVKAKEKAKEKAKAKAEAKAKAKEKAKEKAKAKAEAKAEKNRKKEALEKEKRWKKTLKQELSNATKNEKALYKLLSKVYEEALGRYWWDEVFEFDWDGDAHWYDGWHLEALWKNTKQLLKNGFSLPEKVKKYYTKYAVLRESLENDYKNRPEENPLFKYEEDMDDVVRVLEKMDEFQKNLDELFQKKCNLYYKSGDDYYNVLMKDLEDYESQYDYDAMDHYGFLKPYPNEKFSVMVNGKWEWGDGYYECLPLLTWLDE